MTAELLQLPFRHIPTPTTCCGASRRILLSAVVPVRKDPYLPVFSRTNPRSAFPIVGQSFQPVPAFEPCTLHTAHRAIDLRLPALTRPRSAGLRPGVPSSSIPPHSFR